MGAINSCVKVQKQIDAELNLQGRLSPSIAKQWYTQNFSQTDIWKSAWLKSKKFIDWKNPVYKKIGERGMLEFPLLKQHSILSVPGGKLSATQIRQVVNASLKKVLFIKKPDNITYIREIDYVPDWDYLQQHSFNISKSSLGLIGDDFTGTVLVKDWNGILISMRYVQDGKVTKQIRRATAQPSAARTASCQYVQYCMWYEDCEVIGDQWTDNCGEPYMDPYDCYYDYVCDGDDDPCIMYGDCGGGGGGNNNGQCQMSEAAALSILNQITLTPVYDGNSEIDNMHLDNDSIYRANNPSKWGFCKLNIIPGYSASYTAYFNGGVYKSKLSDQWKWEYLNFINSSMSSGEIPPCIEIENNTAFSTWISNDRSFARANGTGNFIARVSCLAGLKTAQFDLGNIFKDFYAN
ncbi:MAG: hypothetical protein JSS98_10610 [Bacteroidetes bacterium]|nr:hypothetical protein [Bacteroidota bacterium]